MICCIDFKCLHWYHAVIHRRNDPAFGNFLSVKHTFLIEHLSAVKTAADLTCEDFIFHSPAVSIFQKGKRIFFPDPRFWKHAVGWEIVSNQVTVLYGHLFSAQGNIHKCIIQMIFKKIDLWKCDILPFFPNPENISQWQTVIGQRYFGTVTVGLRLQCSDTV